MDIDELLTEAHKRGASDLHITVGIPPAIRVDGRLMHMEGYSKLLPPDTKKLVDSLLNPKQQESFEERGELDFSYSIPTIGRFRCNVFRQRGSSAAVIRLISSAIRNLEELHMPKILEELAVKPRGLVLVTGPTGSGKSTTLAAMIDLINRQEHKHIITLEDPIEYLHSHKKSIVNQREIGLDSHSFAVALRVCLRQDPDIILVGEMRDMETISTAITAAETGHLVFATLHTSGAAQTIDRIIDVFPPHQQQQVRIQLAMAVQGIISQQLLPIIDGPGREVAVELMLGTPAIRNLIREGKTHQINSLIQTGGQQGMITMDSSLRSLYIKGKISYETALEHAVDKDNLVRMLQLN